MMAKEFQMSMIGELHVFLGFQVKQLREGNFIYQEKYTKDLLKRFNMENCKPLHTPMATSKPVDDDAKGKPVNPKLYSVGERVGYDSI